MRDNYQIPAIALIAALMLAFAYLHSRFRSVRTLLWMLAVGCAEVQAILLWLIANWTTAATAGTTLPGLTSQALAPQIPALPLIPLSAAAETAVMLSSALFLASLSPLSFAVGRIRILFVIPYILPILIYVGLYFGISQHPSGPLLQLYAFLAFWTTGIAFFWSMQKGVIPIWMATLLVLGGGILCATWVLKGDVYWPLLVVQSGNLMMTSLLIIFTFRRLSPGVILATTGFLSWALPPLFLIHPVDNLGSSPLLLTLLLTRIAVLGKVFLAIGLILLVLEEEVDKNEIAQRREHRVRVELEAYARQPLTARNLDDFNRESSQLCALIAEQSRFAGVGMLVRIPNGSFSLVGSSGMDGATAGALDDLARCLPPTCFSPPASASTEATGNSSEISLKPEAQAALSSYSPIPESSLINLDLRPWLTPGHDLERLGLTRIAAIPLLGPNLGSSLGSSRRPHLAPGDSADGALLLTKPRVPLASLHRDDLLPIEILAGRLQAARAQALMLGKLIDSERFAGVGQLATNVAQQLNNPLTVILGYSALLEESTSNSADFRGAEAISIEARRMKSILARLSRFSRLSTERFSSFAIAELITDIEQMHRTDFLRHSIEFHVAVQPDLPQIFGNANQVRQALLHVTQYAIESVIRVGHNQEKSMRIEVFSPADEEGSIDILVAHSGQGFAHPDRAFESLSSGFTTSESTGIGLSLAAAIVAEHRGTITAINYQPTGAAILISLPIS